MLTQRRHNKMCVSERMPSEEECLVSCSSGWTFGLAECSERIYATLPHFHDKHSTQHLIRIHTCTSWRVRHFCPSCAVWFYICFKANKFLLLLAQIHYLCKLTGFGMHTYTSRLSCSSHVGTQHHPLMSVLHTLIYPLLSTCLDHQLSHIEYVFSQSKRTLGYTVSNTVYYYSNGAPIIIHAVKIKTWHVMLIFFMKSDKQRRCWVFLPCNTIACYVGAA